MSATVAVSHAPFKYVAGNPSLDLVNTVDWQHDGSVDQERLASYPRLIEWAEGAGLLLPTVGDRLRSRARRDPAAADAALNYAIALRGAVRTVFRAVTAGTPLDRVLGELDGPLRKALERLELRAGSGTAGWGWRGFETELEAPLWPVTWAAAALLTSADAAKIRTCGAADCGWMYVDRSRNGLRRWCDMRTCGARAKARRHYRRTRESAFDE